MTETRAELFNQSLEDLYVYLRVHEWDLSTITDYVEFASQIEPFRITMRVEEELRALDKALDKAVSDAS